MKSTFIRIRITAISFISELRAIFTDSGALLVLLGASIIYPIVYSIAYKENVIREMPVAVVDLDNTSSSRQISKMIDATEKLQVITKPPSLNEAEKLFWKDENKGIILIPADFEKNLLKGQQTNLSVYCDASYFMVYKETLAATFTASSTLSGALEIRQYMANGSSFEQAIVQQNPLQAKYYSLYNPSGAYGFYLMPGILIVILQQTILIGIGIISGSGREMKQHYSVPGLNYKRGNFSIIIGKSLAYFLVALVTSIFTLVWIYDWFQMLSKGSILAVLSILIPFIFATIYLGLAISFLFHKREHSIMFLVFLSPIILFLSGISWPIEAMPKGIQIFANLFPSSHMVPAYLRIRTMGVDIMHVNSEIIILYTQTFIYFFMAAGLFKLMKLRNKKEKIQFYFR